MALEWDIPVLDFWTMTYGEVVDTLNASSKRYQNRLREKALMDYKLADLIAANVALMFKKDAQIPTLFDAYPALFEKEKQLQDEKREEAEMEIWKERMKGFAQEHNRKWGEKH